MLLKTQKRLAVVFAAVVGIGALGYLLKPSPKAHKQPAPMSDVVHTPAPTAPVVPQARPANPLKQTGDNADQKATKLEALRTADEALLTSKGFRNIRADMNRLGNCVKTGSDTGNGLTDGSGYHGTSSAISYTADNNVGSFNICVQHSGKGGSKVQVYGHKIR